MSGMVEYEFSTRKWTNYTEVGFLKSNEALEGGRAQFVELPLGLGEDEDKKGGVVMVFSGGVYALPVTKKGDSRGIVRPDRLLDFQNLTFFDADTKKWYSQMTTGTPPIGRMGHCVAGARSKAGTYEMYISLLQSFSGPDPILTNGGQLHIRWRRCRVHRVLR